MASKKSSKKSAKKATKKAVSKKATAKKSSKKKSTSKKAAKKAAKKAPVKKSSAQEPVFEPRRSGPGIAPLVFAGLGLLVIVAGLIFYFGGFAGEPADAGAQVSGGEVIATVNGEDITQDQLDTQYALLPQQYRQELSKDDVLTQLIDEELVLQYARDQGISVTQEEVNAEVQSILSSGELTLAQLQDNLDAFDLTIEDFEALVERRIMLERALEALSYDEAGVEEARAYYENNTEQFVQPRQAEVRHILLASQRENAAQLGSELKDRVEAGDDFCMLVQNYTDDQGSRESCGEYTFSSGQMVAPFEEASFELETGEVTLIQTQFGYHVIEKLGEIPSEQVSFADVQDQIVSQLSQQAQLEAYQSFISDRREEASITRAGE